MASLVFASPNAGPTWVDAAMNQLFADAATGSGIAYVLGEVRNTHPSLTLPAGSLWTVPVAGCGTYAVALADAMARALGYLYTLPNPAGLTYSTPTSQAGGLAMPALAASQKCLIAIKWDLTAAAVSWPSSPAIAYGCTAAPIGYT
ncbi:MAG: hypothetical protein KBF43_09045 [Dermatophilaceae bacterium]|nr:hypothetical protein [Dermatophilaceae bacterium]MBP9918718.1 hypothetical protein [Dermatophilaceae bacterium]